MTQRLIEAVEKAIEALQLVDANSVRWCFSPIIKELNEALMEHVMEQQSHKDIDVPFKKDA